jgi:hypothetical protein
LIPKITGSIDDSRGSWTIAGQGRVPEAEVVRRLASKSSLPASGIMEGAEARFWEAMFWKVFHRPQAS